MIIKCFSIGNTPLTQVDKIIEKNGVKILGDSNIDNKLPISASNFMLKMYLILLNLMIKKKIELNLNLEDEIIEKTLIK